MLRAITARHRPGPARGHRPGPARGRQGGSGRLARTAVVGLVAALAVPLGGAPAQAGAVRPDAPAPAPAPVGRIAADPIAHDPTVIKQGRYYYTVITGDAATRSYLPIKRSADLLHWTELGTVFDTPPAWVVAELGVTPADFWAPDLSYFDGAYHLYYAASSFGTNNSVIGLATSRTLDPASPAYGWVDHGMVMRSSGTDTFNAIDPDVVFDADGQPWLSFGSFWDGLRIRRLDRSTGMPADGTLHHIASRGAPRSRVRRSSAGAATTTSSPASTSAAGASTPTTARWSAAPPSSPAPTWTGTGCRCSPVAAPTCCAATTSSGAPAAGTSSPARAATGSPTTTTTPRTPGRRSSRYAR
ncbi:hypothetical protein C6361_31140 [Plantactinospora sp. BC1]|nr:hypothetical protein C6361_31140 [Plantactinospora sp. BC1]